MSSSPDIDTGVVGHTTSHNSLGAFDDTLVLWWLSDAGTCCKHTQRLLFRECLNSGLNWAYWTWSQLSLSVFQNQSESYSISNGWSILQGFQRLVMWIHAQKVIHRESFDYIIWISMTCMNQVLIFTYTIMSSHAFTKKKERRCLAWSHTYWTS